VGSDGVMGRHIESGGLVGIACFGRAGESGGRVRDNRGRVRKMRAGEKCAAGSKRGGQVNFFCLVKAPIAMHDVIMAGR
jgi:hypothetical protein